MFRYCVKFLFLFFISSINNAAFATLICYTDDFNRSTLGSDWKLETNRGTLPRLATHVGQQVLLMQDHRNLSLGAAYYNFAIPSDGLVTVEFDYYIERNNRSANGTTVVFSDASIGAKFGGNRGSVGYPRINGISGFHGGWMGMSTDSFGQFSNPIDRRNGGPGKRPKSFAIRGSYKANYPYIVGTGTMSEWMFDDGDANTGHKIKITLDSRQEPWNWVTVERDIHDGRGYQDVISKFNIGSYPDQKPLPPHFWISFVSTNGGYFSEPKYIDNVKICFDTTPFVHHLELLYTASQPITCQPLDVRIKACREASCNQVVNDSFIMNLTSSNPSVATFKFSSFMVPHGMGVDPLIGRQAGTLTMDASITEPVLNSTLCRNGSDPASRGACTLTFVNSGFLISVPDKLAGKAVTGSISAVRSSNNARECVPTMANVTKTVKFWSSYLSPSRPVSVSGSLPKIRINGRDIGNSESTATDINLTFDATGTATFSVNYFDAGKVALHAKLDDPWINLQGADSFVSVPIGLCISSSPTCLAADASCPVRAKAGEKIDIGISAHRWISSDDGNVCNNPLTPNYNQSGVSLGTRVMAPSGGVNGTVGVTSYNHIPDPTGTNIIRQDPREVGVFAFTATPPPNYLGSTASFADIPQAESKPVGRFVPAYFDVTNHEVHAGCKIGSDAFSYMGQPHQVQFKLTAKNIQHQLTKNYVSSTTAEQNFAHSSFTLVAANNNDGNDLSTRLNYTPTPLTWALGEVNVLENLTFSRLPAATKDGPFDRLELGIVMHDGDSKAELFAADFHPAIAGNCHFGINYCIARYLGQEHVHYGRMILNNTFGPNHSPINMLVKAETWRGSEWLTNSFDSCTASGTAFDQFDPALVTDVDDPSLGYQYDPALIAGQTVTRIGNGSLVKGKSWLTWNTSSVGSTPLFTGKVTAPLPVPSWLKYNWNWSGGTPTLQLDPRGSVKFNRGAAKTKAMYWREL